MWMRTRRKWIKECVYLDNGQKSVVLCRQGCTRKRSQINKGMWVIKRWRGSEGRGRQAVLRNWSGLGLSE